MTRVLFITAHRLGDAVISLGVLVGLMKRYPQARFTIACGPAVRDLFAYMPGCERVLVMEKRACNGHWFALWRQVVRYRWAVVVDLRSSLLAYGVRAGSRQVVRGGRQAGLKRDQQARALGFTRAFLPHIWLGKEEQEQARALLPSGTSWLALAPTAGTENKMWPAVSFARLAAALRQKGLRPVLLYGPGEREAGLAAPARAAMPDALDLGGRHSLALVAALLARCRLFVGNDSGLMHLAAASDVPTVGLFGPSLASQYAPAGFRVKTVSAPGAPGQGDMARLAVTDVLEEAVRLYECSGAG